MGASPSIVETGTTFTRVMLGGNATVVLMFLINAVFRGAGDAAIAMRVLWLANAINIVLGPCLIFGLGPFPALGVTGAAVATKLGRGTGVLFQLYILSRRGGRLRIDGAAPAARRRGDARHLAAVVGRGVFQILISTTSWVLLVRILSTFGSAVARRQHHRHPADHLRDAAGLGAGQRRGDDGRAGAGRRQAGARGARRLAGGPLQRLCSRAVSVVFIVAARPIVGIFTDDPAVARTRWRCLRTVGVGFVAFGFGMTLAAPSTAPATRGRRRGSTSCCFWCFEIPLAYVLARRWAGARSACSSRSRSRSSCTRR